MEQALETLLKTRGLSPRGTLRALGGGDIAAVYWLETSGGPVVVKRDNAERLSGEADGLRALRKAITVLIVPEVLALGDGWLVMEALQSSSRSTGSAVALGQGLRQLHLHTASEHGWPRDNACGRTPQPNAPFADGRVFQRERRLLPLARACHERGLLDYRLRGRIEAVAGALESWLPDAPASLLHGDLWSGNVLHTPQGPAVIDPAVYRHFPEVDLAMLTLFGAPGEAFFEAYWDGDAPLDWPRREALFQLYPLLNHLLLFGGGYRDAVERAVGRVEQE
ncbi:MAG: fructosamine kinase family protein [Halomonas sp.]|uniref:Aminoglycoside phosphotransferase n=1 Tax=Billgrantia tianxiuensis TaxID=2497861 RepID=A0A6I6SG86_9GAMM|nr:MULTISPECIES: fructosamine kinase family protein [Halomonas]MCE8032566.1 phosphotransferase [Halomonas sp. MCCC 1A11057]MDX5434421.1 fructosamine kinase family protein [Halomonas sp.]QHC49499.1 aminoglycoside phosphotransferase [Halomonas tianxiuensis]